MNEIVAYDPSTVTRVSLSDVDNVPWTGVDMQDALVDLPPRVFKVLAWLRLSLRRYGQLPIGIRALAEIAHVRPASFERMVPDLDRHFARDADGRWTDHALLRARGRCAVVPAKERVIDPALSEKRRAACYRSHEARGLPSTATRKNGAANSDESLHPFSCKTTSEIEAGESADGANLHPSSPLLASKLASLPDEEDAKQASKPANGPARAGANAPNPPRGADANEGAKPLAANGANGGGTAGQASPSDAVIIDAVLRKCPDKVSKGDVHNVLPLYREAIADGLDFFKDILPKIEAFARNKPRLDNPANRHIMADARAHHASRRAAEALAAPGASQPPPVFADPRLARFADELRTRVGAEPFSSWFEGMAIAGVAGGTMTLSLPSRFKRDYVDRTFGAQATAALRASEPALKAVAFVMAAAPAPAAP